MIFWRGDSSRKNPEEAGNRKNQERMSGASPFNQFPSTGED